MTAGDKINIVSGSVWADSTNNKIIVTVIPERSKIRSNGLNTLSIKAPAFVLAGIK